MTASAKPLEKEVAHRVMLQQVLREAGAAGVTA